MPLRILLLNKVPIYQQLLLEEHLLRHTTDNICLCNTNASKAIVMGISGKPQELIALDVLQKDPIPVIKRFSGGGTVIIDEDTLFVSWIFSKSLLGTSVYPETILSWSTSLFTPAFALPGFRLCENDFALHDKKCGGNALYITKERFLQHTSFLWNFTETNMNYLLHPKKSPSYRKERSHTEFLCTLQPYFADKYTPFHKLCAFLSNHFAVTVDTTIPSFPSQGRTCIL